MSAARSPAARYTWSKVPLPTGLARVFAAARPREWQLKRARERIAAVAYAAEYGGWYFYADGYNSLWTGRAWGTADEAKTACVEWMKERSK